MTGAEPIFAGARPMRVAVLASGTGGNLRAVLRLAARRPDLVEVVMVASDRPECRAVEIARRHGVPVLARDFLASCGRASEATTPAARAAYADRARAFHDRLSDELWAFEQGSGAIDLVVCAYGRWIHGRLLERFAGRMINQHPADLCVLNGAGARALTGNNPVLGALRAGHPHVRTSTFLVDEGHDTGPVLGRGPRVATAGSPPSQEAADALEALQKERSDWPVLTCVLLAIARGALAVDRSRRAPDGSALFRLLEHPLPFGGLDLEALPALDGGPGLRALRDEMLETLREAEAAAA